MVVNRTIPIALVLGRTLALFRQELGLTQRELSRRCGLGQATIALIETGRMNAYLVQVYAIEVALLPFLLDHLGASLEVLGEALGELHARGAEVVPGKADAAPDRELLAAVDEVVQVTGCRVGWKTTVPTLTGRPVGLVLPIEDRRWSPPLPPGPATRRKRAR